jgi:hypothetical protein
MQLEAADAHRVIAALIWPGDEAVDGDATEARARAQDELREQEPSVVALRKPPVPLGL